MATYSHAHICQCLGRLATARRALYRYHQWRPPQNRNAIRPRSYGPRPPPSSPRCQARPRRLHFCSQQSLEEAKSAMEVAQPVLLVTDSSRGFWHSKFQIDSVPSLRWHVLMDTPVRGNDKGTVFATELLNEPTGTSVTLDYRWAPEGAAVICFTSGTTGRPKGATISHSAIVVQSLAKIAIVRYDEDDVYLHTAPLCHIGGISSAMAMLMAGGCHVMLPKFDTNLAIEAIREHNVTSLITVPTMMADLITFNRMKKTSETFESVKKILNGGGGLSAELIREATKIFPRATLLSAYGMTEACSSLTFMTLYDPAKDSRFQQPHDVKKSNLSREGGVCVGKPAPHIELRVSAEESLSAGRILMRVPMQCSITGVKVRPSIWIAYMKSGLTLEI
ncbi:UNVERIFIED_CONTAM: 2-succinylbenzoate--CoA ligase, chloroplastic/peroxisomal [Sesamum angustifolium]|uniref:2-succinylbenzoate--CoA ligase, chloroplastic/peroxisomal n=1 Tax=Sesamum angustifolium TaxID=2727405 RepID=A0AAW2KUB1_9LAMI